MVTTSKLCPDRGSSLGMSLCDNQITLGSWRIPFELLEFYRGVGVSSLFEWQVQCLTLPGVLDGKRNLIFAAPTSAGKTLVAEILMWKRLTETKRKAIYIVPFVSVGREKVVYLQTLFKTVGLKIDAYIGNQNSVIGIRSWDVAVCTIEKANNLINRCIEENTLDLIGTIVIDEFHILGDSQRGYLVELLVTKVLQMSRMRHIDIQLVAMSATISNLSFLSRWLNAVEYTTDFRPVALSESLFTEGKYCDRGLNSIGTLHQDYILPNDQDNIVGLCLETVISGQGVLVFCATKAWCEKLSETIAATFGKIVRKFVAANLADRLRSVLNQANSSNTFLHEYKRIVGIIDPVLARTLPFAVAFHHAGLTMEERDQLERGFRNGNIRVLVATSTLSSGVNLPARRVIVRSPWGQTGATTGPCLTNAAYKQMVGRAGRQGFNAEGESVIVCKRQEVKRALDLMNGTLESVGSALVNKQKPSDNGILAAASVRFKRAILEAIVGNLANTADELIEYVKCTLMATEVIYSDDKGSEIIRKIVAECVDYLSVQQFISADGDMLSATQLGRATLASAMNPEEAWFMFQDLKQAQRAMVLDNELHMVYLVTPTYMQDQWGPDFDWFCYHRIWSRLNDDQRHVADLLGISEAFILMATRRRNVQSRGSMSNEARKYAIHMRFYTALALFELIEESPISVVAEKYGCNRGFLQALQQQASTYAGMSIAFCDRLGWWYMKTLLSGFAERIAFGVRRELTELVQIDGIDGSRARCFHHSGYTTLASLVYAQSNEIAAALRKAVPFKNETEATGALKRCWLSGHPDMSEEQAVSMIQARAKSILEENLNRFGISLEKCASTILTTKTVFEPNTDSKNDELKQQTEIFDDILPNGKKSIVDDRLIEVATSDQVIRKTDPPDSSSVDGSIECMNAINVIKMDLLEKSVAKTIPTDHLDESKSKRIDSDPHDQSIANGNDIPYGQSIIKDKIDPIVQSVAVAVSTEIDSPDQSILESISSPAAKMPIDQVPLTDYDDLDDILMNMSRVSITPRSNNDDATPKLDSISKNRSLDLPLTESQFAKIFNDSGSGSPILRRDNGNVREQQEEPCPNFFTIENLPMSLSKLEIDKIRNTSKIDFATEPGDEDLFDGEDQNNEENIFRKNSDGEDNNSSDNGTIANLVTSPDLFDDPPPVKVAATNLCQTPVSKMRKRQRAIRSRGGSEYSTPSPLVKKSLRRSTTTQIDTDSGFDQFPKSENSDQISDPIGGNRLEKSESGVGSDGVQERFESKVLAGKSEQAEKQEETLIFQSTQRKSGSIDNLSIIDVCSSFETFSTFASEWRRQKRFAITMAVGNAKKDCDGGNGWGCTSNDILGIAVCWSSTDVHYLSLRDRDFEDQVKNQGNTSSFEIISLKERLRLIKRCLCVKLAEANEKIVFDFLQIQKLIGKLLNDSLVGLVNCVRTADWLLTCGKEESLPLNKIDDLIDRYPNSVKEINQSRDSDVKSKTCFDSLLLFAVWLDLESRLKRDQLWTAFVETEIPASKVVAQMESNGIGFDFETCRQVCSHLKKTLENLEERAFASAGRSFSLTSYAELAKILFVELNLPADGASTSIVQSKRHHGQKTKRHYSTSKEVLERLQKFHQLPRLILDWRKINGALTTAIYPLMKRCYTSETIESKKRIYGFYDWYTATGRVIMHEPSLQIMPREFEVGGTNGVMEAVNIRNLIAAEEGFVLISADYSQLELRIMAHLSEDEKLLEILNSDTGDVFRIIASAWLGLSIEEVDSEQRQRAKKLCYGVVYGMGARTLAEELEVSEETAVGFMDAFKQQFPGVFRWIADTIAKTRECGYAKTLAGRVRYLPAIRNLIAVDQRLHAERQAVNTSVQGSAADVFKAALRDVDDALSKCYTKMESPYRFVLQLHDELILEVKESIVDQIAEIVRRRMEQCYRLRVKLRVRLVSGKTWGDLKPMQLFINRFKTRSNFVYNVSVHT